jgi:hypothetical protein
MSRNWHGWAAIRGSTVSRRDTMQQRAVSALIMIAGTIVLTSGIEAGERFKRLTGRQIQAKFTGMEMSDDVHWRDRYERNGALTSQSMGRNYEGKWWIEKRALCIDLGKDRGGCYEVWLAGNKVEFRRTGLEASILAGTLQSPTGRR